MAQTELRSGALTMVFEDSNCMLRSVRLGEREVVRGVYAAIRDRNWNTIPFRVRDLQIDWRESDFAIQWTALCSSDGIELEWNGQLTGSASGWIRFQFRGRALQSFLKNRIGLCVLHPIRECSGQSCVVEHSDGRRTVGSFPQWISPHQPFRDIRRISHRVDGDHWARVSFRGDVFEMEDQRNWTDASFKIYSTPLDLPFPVELKQGEIIEQGVEIALVEESSAASEPMVMSTSSWKGNSAFPKVKVDWSRSRDRPAIGLQIGDENPIFAMAVLQRLKQTGLDHLRVDLRLENPSWISVLQSAIEVAKGCRCQLEIALLTAGISDEQWRILETFLKDSRIPIARWLLFHSLEKTTPASLVAEFRSRVKGIHSAIPLAIGTDYYFAELNRNPPQLDHRMLVCYSINPQVHASDSRSVMENLEALPDTLTSVEHFIGNGVVVSPITLKPRSNPNATSFMSRQDQLRQAIDARQSRSFAAAWTAGVIAQMAIRPNLRSMTFFEVAGPRGIMNEEGEEYPVGKLLGLVAGCRTLAEAECTTPNSILAFGAESHQGDKLIVVSNLTEKDVQFDLDIGAAGVQRRTIAPESIEIFTSKVRTDE